MTITTTDVKSVYEGDGATVKFNIAFEYFANSDVKVYLRNNAVSPYTETLKTLNVHYTLTDLVGLFYTTITMVSTPVDNSGGVGEQVIIIRSIPLTQMNTPTGTGVEDSLDRSVASLQELDERLDRSLTLPISETASTVLPVGADKYIKWNAAGTALEVASISLTTIQNDINNAESDIDALEVRMLAAEGDIDDLEAAVVGIPAQLLALQNSVLSLGSVDTSLQNQITILTASIVTLNGSLSDLANAFGLLTSQTIVNNQVTPLAITALTIDGDVYTSVICEFELRRRTTSNNLHSVGVLNLVFRDNSVWETERGLTSFDIDGVTFTIETSAGNIGTVKYVSTSLAGAGYSGTMKMRIKKFEV